MTQKKMLLTFAILTLAAAVGCSKVPDLTGMTKDQAQAELAKDKLQMGSVTLANQPGKTAGTVIDQDPKPKEKIPDNKVIALVLQSDGSSAQTGSNGTTGGTTTGTNNATGSNQPPVTPSTVTVPNFNGQTQNDAEAMINQLGLVPGNMNVVLNDKPAGKVFDQDPPAGTSVPMGTQVTLSIASDALVTVPTVTGQPQAVAEQMLKAAQLVPVTEFDIHPGSDPVGSVFECSGQGLRIAKGQNITLKVKQESATVPHVVGQTLQQAQLMLYQNNLTPVVHYVHDPSNVLKVTAQTYPDNYPVAKYAPVGITVGALDFGLIGRYVVLAQPQVAATQKIQVNKMVTMFKR